VVGAMATRGAMNVVALKRAARSVESQLALAFGDCRRPWGVFLRGPGYEDFFSVANMLPTPGSSTTRQEHPTFVDLSGAGAGN
jgi:hypothetical protein